MKQDDDNEVALHKIHIDDKIKIVINPGKISEEGTVIKFDMKKRKICAEYCKIKAYHEDQDMAINLCMIKYVKIYLENLLKKYSN